jgi:hypothetical protein
LPDAVTEGGSRPNVVERGGKAYWSPLLARAVIGKGQKRPSGCDAEQKLRDGTVSAVEHVAAVRTLRRGRDAVVERKVRAEIFVFLVKREWV